MTGGRGWRRGRTELGDEGEVEAELFHEPVDGTAAALGEDLVEPGVSGRVTGEGQRGIRRRISRANIS